MSQNKNTRISDFLWLLPFFIFFSTYFILHLVFISHTLHMPDIIGKNLTDATKTCSLLQLRPQIIQIKKDDNVPPNTVIHQTPSPNKLIKEQQTVYLAITEKSTSKITPNCTGLSRDQIKQNLVSMQLKPKFHEIESSYPASYCFCQWPAPNCPTKTKTIICYIAKQPEKKFIFPNLKNKTLLEAQQILSTYDIKAETDLLVNNTYTYYIVDQQPKAGFIIDLSHPKQITAYLKIKHKKSKSPSIKTKRAY